MKFVSYLTDLDQANAIADYIMRCRGQHVDAYLESGRKPIQLRKAIDRANKEKAILLIAKMERLSRNVPFLTEIMTSGIEVAAADNPAINRVTLRVIANLAETESRTISERTRKALAALKERGVKLGSARPGHWEGKEHIRLKALEKARTLSVDAIHQNKMRAYAGVLPMMKMMKGEGKKLREIADHLNKTGHKSRRGKKWTAMQVFRVLKMEAT